MSTFRHTSRLTLFTGSTKNGPPLPLTMTAKNFGLTAAKSESQVISVILMSLIQSSCYTKNKLQIVVLNICTYFDWLAKDMAANEDKIDDIINSRSPKFALSNDIHD